MTSRKLARYEELLVDIFPMVTDSVRTMIDQARRQDYRLLEGTCADDSVTSASSSALGLEQKAGSPDVGKPPLPLPIPLAHLGQSFTSPQKPLPPPPSPFEASLSPSRSKSSIPRSDMSTPEDLSVNAALRLPSITRQGFLVEDASLGQRNQRSVTAGSEAQRGREKSREEDVPSGLSNVLRPG
ncbi:hypothetical protein OHC33_001139 [Knufia fluminis]|uniref:Uncharacterized protein n=1 Tax=Knufia fluminis TaxID=191047 RepID=A0AAN8I8V1_9EURO|nr:hypothetical protein OHC33_001139 [Knufia fluminis]